MQRKDFLKGPIGLLSAAVFLGSCKKTDITTATTPTTSVGTGSPCLVAPTGTDEPYPYPGGEITNPINGSDITGGRIHYITKAVFPLGALLTG